MPPKVLNPAEKAWVKIKKIDSKIREGITILDCTVRTRERCSEGAFLDEYIKILNRQRTEFNKEPVERTLRYVRSAKGGTSSLQDWLKYVYTWTIHISAHGGQDEETGETVLVAGNSQFRLKDLKNIWSDREGEWKPLLIVLSACTAGHKDLIKAFAAEGCRYCIAPVFEANWEKAALFSALFYTYLFFGPRDKYGPLRPRSSFGKAKGCLKELTGWWKMFDYGEEVR
jgi:hypothetical protein